MALSVVVAVNRTLHFNRSGAPSVVYIVISIHPIIYIDVKIPVVTVSWYTAVVVVAVRVITPIVGRMPNHIVRAQKPGENDRSTYICRFNNIVWAIKVGVADYLNVVASIIPFNVNCCNVLKNISVQHGLNGNQVHAVIVLLNNPKVIYITVVVEVEI